MNEHSSFRNLVKSLLAHERQVVIAYDAAIKKAGSYKKARPIIRFRYDAYRTITELMEIAEERNIEFASPAQFTDARQGWSLRFEKENLFSLLQEIEENAIGLYHQALGHGDCFEDLRKICENALADRERHLKKLATLNSSTPIAA